MPVLRIDNYLDDYRLRAQSNDIHELAGRPNKNATTEFVNTQILAAIEPNPFDVLVDVGCGDATLMKMAEGRVSECIGIVSTEEEKARLESALPKLRFIASAAQKLPLPSNCASKVVCNGVLAYLLVSREVRASLREMARIARPGATIWVGEISEIDGYAYYRMYRGNSMFGFLWHLLRHNGLRSFLGMIRRWLKAVTGSEQIILNSASMFYASPEKMISLAQDCGLQLKTYFRHKELDQAGALVESKFSYNYIFTPLK
ncbi:MAG: class I SAM-dependent methyltransferase [Terriglobales bacterium]